MTFLIMQIFIYLLLAGVIGGAAGWLVRNLQAQRTEEAAGRAVHDAKSKLPQLESLLRSRDDQNTKLKTELKSAKTELKQREQSRRGLETQLAEAQRKMKQLESKAQQRAQAIDDDLQLEPDSHNDDQLIAQLSEEIVQLKRALADAHTQAQEKSGSDLREVEREALQLQLSTAERKYTAAAKELKVEKEKVAELERERDLQNKSLQVLHQQLEMERSRRARA